MKNKQRSRGAGETRICLRSIARIDRSPDRMNGLTEFMSHSIHNKRKTSMGTLNIIVIEDQATTAAEWALIIIINRRLQPFGPNSQLHNDYIY